MSGVVVPRVVVAAPSLPRDIQRSPLPRHCCWMPIRNPHKPPHLQPRRRADDQIPFLTQFHHRSTASRTSSLPRPDNHPNGSDDGAIWRPHPVASSNAYQCNRTILETENKFPNLYTVTFLHEFVTTPRILYVRRLEAGSHLWLSPSRYRVSSLFIRSSTGLGVEDGVGTSVCSHLYLDIVGDQSHRYCVTCSDFAGDSRGNVCNGP